MHAARFRVRSWTRVVGRLTVLAALICPALAQAQSYDYRVLATSKTSTLEKELNEAADAGFRFSFVMGGDTAIGGSEGVAVMTRAPSGASFAYKLLANRLRDGACPSCGTRIDGVWA